MGVLLVLLLIAQGPLDSAAAAAEEDLAAAERVLAEAVARTAEAEANIETVREDAKLLWQTQSNKGR